MELQRFELWSGQTDDKLSTSLVYCQIVGIMLCNKQNYIIRNSFKYMQSKKSTLSIAGPEVFDAHKYPIGCQMQGTKASNLLGLGSHGVFVFAI